MSVYLTPAPKSWPPATRRSLVAVARAARELADARDRLTDAMVAARAAGATFQAIADCAGVTRQSVVRTTQPPPQRKGEKTP